MYKINWALITYNDWCAIKPNKTKKVTDGVFETQSFWMKGLSRVKYR